MLGFWNNQGDKTENTTQEATHYLEFKALYASAFPGVMSGVPLKTLIAPNLAQVSPNYYIKVR